MRYAETLGLKVVRCKLEWAWKFPLLFKRWDATDARTHTVSKLKLMPRLKGCHMQITAEPLLAVYCLKVC